MTLSSLQGGRTSMGQASFLRPQGMMAGLGTVRF